jgi:hypothetical protein
MERDLAGVIAEMADDFPLVASLVERRAGGQKKLPIATGNEAMSLQAPAPVGLHAGMDAGADGRVSPDTRPPEESVSTPAESGEAPAQGAEEREKPEATATADLAWPGGRARRRPARLGLSIQFESRPDDPQLGRLVESTVWVNEAHPAYHRAAASRAEGYHVALTVALALATLAVEPVEAHRFVTAFLARWGEAIDRPVRRRRRRKKGR